MSRDILVHLIFLKGTNSHSAFHNLNVAYGLSSGVQYSTQVLFFLFLSRKTFQQSTVIPWMSEHF